MKKINFLLSVLLVAFSFVNAQTQWEIDKAHSKVGFSVTHLVVSEVEGQFNDFSGTILTNGDDFSDAKIEFIINVGSINTDNVGRDKHLKSDDFFNAEKFPTITFKSKSMTKIGDKKYKLIGDFTMRDVTKEIALDVKFNGTVNDPWGNTKAGFKVTGEVNRFDYNLKWNKRIETGGLVAGDIVSLNINLELAKKK
ncbi:MAG: YceI family protein [Ignavibacteriales bacterium]